MGIMVVGGDNIRNINCHLCEEGFCVIKHVDGRKKNHKCIEIPKGVEMILVLTDFINHKLCEHIKKESKKLGIKIIYTKRSWSYVKIFL